MTKKWYNRKQVPFSELEEHPCPNCNHVFAGRYCPNCGQSTTEFDRPFGFIFYDFLGNFVAFDSRLFKTIGTLMFRPGKLTSEFFKGKRMTYAPPFRVFIFFSFILFLLLQIVTSRSLTDVLEYSYKDSKVLADSISLAELDSMNVDFDIMQRSDSIQTVNFKLNRSILGKQENLQGTLLYIAGELEEQYEKSEDEGERRTLLTLIDICRSPDQLVSRILKYLSWAFFLLLPVFALLLKLLYVRRKINYIKHLVFSVHLHSFMFLLYTIIVIINMVFAGEWTLYLLWALLLLPVYLVIAMKNFYQQKWSKVLLKGFIISVVYNSIIFMAFGLIIMNAISDL